MITSDTLSLRDAARRLDLEPARVARLARYLSLMPSEHQVPRSEVERIYESGGGEDARYSALRTWLLKHVTPRS